MSGRGCRGWHVCKRSSNVGAPSAQLTDIRAFTIQLRPEMDAGLIAALLPSAVATVRCLLWGCKGLKTLLENIRLSLWLPFVAHKRAHVINDIFN